MDRQALQQQLITCVAQGLASHYDTVCTTLKSEGYYAYTLYCTSGFYGMCIAASTRASLKKIKVKSKQYNDDFLAIMAGHPDLLLERAPFSEWYVEMSACEWEYVYNDVPAFESFDEVLSQIYDYAYDEAAEDFDVGTFLSASILVGIQRFQASVHFDPALLTGLQFADPSEEEMQMMVDISYQVNAPAWHEKVLALHDESNKGQPQGDKR